MKISIITPTYNRRDMLEEAIKNVMAQDYPLEQIEHIIVDGASTDGTLEMLKKYPHLRVTSEPDDGVYDGMNKGIRQATGDIIILLNSDDILPENVISYSVDMIRENPEADAIYGHADLILQDGRRLNRHLDKVRDLKWVSDLTFGPNLNARFFRPKIFEKIGYFKTDYPVASDIDFLLRLAASDIKAILTDRVLYEYRAHEDSLTFHSQSMQAKGWAELMRIGQGGIENSGNRNNLRKLYQDIYTRAAIGFMRTNGINKSELMAMFKNYPLWPFNLCKQIVRWSYRRSLVSNYRRGSIA